jgi:hypothetical protein
LSVAGLVDPPFDVLRAAGAAMWASAARVWLAKVIGPLLHLGLGVDGLNTVKFRYPVDE